MGRILLGCIIGKAPSQLLDFIYISQYPSHNKDSLGYLQVALEQYHANKCILIDLGICVHFNIPKLHSMQHYAECIRNFGTTDNYNTEMFEHFHIDYTKEGWRATNFRDELPADDSVTMFETYLKDYHRTEVEREQEEQDALESETIISKHRCPSFLHHLRVYLNRFLPRGEAISRIQLPHACLPFHQLDVWHTFKFSLDTLGNDVDGQEEIDSVRAKPGKGRAEDYEAESTGLHGMKVGRLKVIFRLPDYIPMMDDAIDAWPKEHLAHVEWLTLSKQPGHHHNMYSVTKAIGLNNNIVPGDIVSLSTIRQSCHLISSLGS
ncbi:hypothetical protein F4604DRAFT_1875833 [Suillus subluteus]|nr:hypothetical protein F4604DRAFT_1875833 [Suillus subluteus]